MSAPEYIEHLMTWVQGNIDNEQMFPSRIGMYSQMRSWRPFAYVFFWCRRSLPQDLP